jgi:hypothetical protein
MAYAPPCGVRRGVGDPARHLAAAKELRTRESTPNACTLSAALLALASGRQKGTLKREGNICRTDVSTAIVSLGCQDACETPAV